MPEGQDTPRRQPQAIFFDLKVNSLSDIYKSGQYPLDIPEAFEYNHTSRAFGQVNIVLNDVSGQVLKRLLDPDKDQTMTVQFGYQGDQPLKSPPIRFQPIKIVPQRMGNSFRIAISGMALGSMTMQTGSGSGTFKENLDILEKKYKDQLSYFKEIKVEPPIDPNQMIEVGAYDLDSTEEREMQHMRLKDESDLAFIRRLCRFARDAEGHTGYTVRPQHNDDGTVSLLIYIPGLSNGIKTSKYTYPSREGNVVSWQTDIDYSNAVIGAFRKAVGIESGSGNVKTNNINPTSVTNANPQETDKTIPFPLRNAQDNGQLNLKSTQNLKDTNENIKSIGSTDPDVAGKDGSGVRLTPMPTTSPFASINPLLYDAIYSQTTVTSSSLVVLGVPNMFPGDLIEMREYYPANYDPRSGNGEELMGTSGKYVINQLSHSINASGFKTTLDLTRREKLE